MSSEILHQQRIIWQNKPVLREIYEDFYRHIMCFCNTGLSLEIGGGGGNFKQYMQDVISTDIVSLPWLDVTADAQMLPFRDASFDNLVMVDVVHHIERPVRLFREANRVLKPGGRLVLCEPAVTPLSWLFYKLLHPEPLDMSADPLADGPLSPDRRPFDANQAFPTLLFGRYRKRLEALFPALHVVRNIRISLFAYPLSGGFRSWSLVPVSWVKPLLRMESALMSALGPMMAFRMLTVLEKQKE